MCVHPQSNRSNTVVLRASYILPNWKQFHGKSPINPGGWAISPLKDPKHKPVCLFQFWGRPFKLAKFYGNRQDSM